MSERADPVAAPERARPRLFIVGPTASGKGALAVAVAERLGGEVISVDSMKVYREMDIGTAKPGPAKRRGVPFHLLDIRDPSERTSAKDLTREALAVEAAILGRGRVPIFAGGTALYVRALTEGLFEGPPRDEALRARLEARADADGNEALHEDLRKVDPDAAARLHPNDRRRVIRALEVHAALGRPISELQREWDRAPRPDRLLFGLEWPREELYRRIDERVVRMMDAGFEGEVRALARRPRGLSPEAEQALGYRELLGWLRGGEAEPLPAVVERIQRNTRRFAKRQLTFFRHFPDLVWLRAPGPAGVAGLADRVVRAYHGGKPEAEESA